jgi:hypothetical protein
MHSTSPRPRQGHGIPSTNQDATRRGKPKLEGTFDRRQIRVRRATGNGGQERIQHHPSPDKDAEFLQLAGTPPDNASATCQRWIRVSKKDDRERIRSHPSPDKDAGFLQPAGTLADEASEGMFKRRQIQVRATRTGRERLSWSRIIREVILEFEPEIGNFIPTLTYR